MSHFDKVVFALRINEFSLPANETCEKLVSLAGNENSLILSAKTTLSKWPIEAERKGEEGKGMERKGKARKGNWSNYYISRVVGRNSYFKVWN